MENKFYNIEVKPIVGEAHTLEKFKGKVLLIVNTASECGLTPQYQQLQELNKKYQNQGLVLLGFPSNDFGAQEPGSNEEIAEFCNLKYRIKFPLFQKAPVKGEQKQKLYSYLTEQSLFKGEITWNFEKFLVNHVGEVKARFSPKTEPASAEVVTKIEALLNDLQGL